MSPITCRKHAQGPTGEDDRLFTFQKLVTEVDSLCILEADERSINDSSILFPGCLSTVSFSMNKWWLSRCGFQLLADVER